MSTSASPLTHSITGILKLDEQEHFIKFRIYRYIGLMSMILGIEVGTHDVKRHHFLLQQHTLHACENCEE